MHVSPSDKRQPCLDSGLRAAAVVQRRLFHRNRAPRSVLWTAPAILLAAMLIAWAAESAQFFIAQGFALAILAWLQTLPEFAVEAVLAWKQQVPLAAGQSHRRAAPAHRPRLADDLLHRRLFHRARRQAAAATRSDWQTSTASRSSACWCAMAYIAVICVKASLTLVDAGDPDRHLRGLPAVLQRMPPEEAETIEDLEPIPRTIVTARRPVRIAVIAGLFRRRRRADLLHGRAVSGQPAGAFGGDRLAELRLHPVGGAVRFRVPGEGLGVLLGAHGGPRPHGADEHGLEQHQPVDAAGRHAADRLFAQPRRAVAPFRFDSAAGVRDPDDAGPASWEPCS